MDISNLKQSTTSPSLTPAVIPSASKATGAIMKSSLTVDKEMGSQKEIPAEHLDPIMETEHVH